MHFLIHAYDSKDASAAQRRAETRDAHLEIIRKYREQGNMLMGAAMLDDNEQMIGSVIVADFPDRAALDVWLSEEPYLQNKVWGEVKVSRCLVGPSFLK